MKVVTAVMPDAASTTAGTTAVWNLPIGRTFHRLLLTYTGITLAQMLAIRVKANGETIMELGTGTELDARNQYDGMQVSAGVLVLDFERRNLQDPKERYLFCIGTGAVHHPADKTAASQLEADKLNAREIKTLTLEIDIDAAAAAIVMTPLKAIQSGPRPLHWVRRMRKYSFSAINGVVDFLQLARNTSQAQYINRLFLKGATITKGQIFMDSLEVWNRLVAENSREQKNGWRVPQAGYFVIDPTESGSGSNNIDTRHVQDFRLTVTDSAAETVTVYAEQVGAL